MNRSNARTSELSGEELAAQEAAELPRREAMSLIDTAMAGTGPLPIDGTGVPADGATMPADGATTPDPAQAGTNPLAGTGIESKLPLSNPFVE
jgi:hypothetical protein